MSSLNFPTFVKRLPYLVAVKYTRAYAAAASLCGCNVARGLSRVCITGGQLFALISVIVIRIYYRAARYCITATNSCDKCTQRSRYERSLRSRLGKGGNGAFRLIWLIDSSMRLFNRSVI